MRDLGTDSIPTGYKLMRRVSHTVSLGLRLGSKTNLRRVVRLDKQAESPAGAHSWHGHYGSARAFAVNPARLTLNAVDVLDAFIRRITIVAMARKLLIALWRYLETGVLPTGAVLKV